MTKQEVDNLQVGDRLLLLETTQTCHVRHIDHTMKVVWVTIEELGHYAFNKSDVQRSFQLFAKPKEDL